MQIINSVISSIDPNHSMSCLRLPKTRNPMSKHNQRQGKKIQDQAFAEKISIREEDAVGEKNRPEVGCICDSKT